MVSTSLPAHLLRPPDDAPDDIHFRLADVADCLPLHAACYPDRPLLPFRSHFNRLIDWQENGRCYWLIVTNPKDHIIANGQLILYPHGAELANLSVISARQNEGIGAAIIGMLTAVARHLALPSLEIGVAVSNGRALALYQRLGFAEDRPLQIPGGEPAIILRKELLS